MNTQTTTPRMQPRDLVLTVIASAGGRSDLGRTSLQKATFFTGVALGRDLGHSAYYYGPYSSLVEAETEALVASGLVEEDSRTFGVNRRGFPVTQYQYKVSEAGAERVERLRGKYSFEVDQIENLMRKLLTVVGSLDQATLSAAAKTFYIAREQGREVTPEDIAGFARDYAWELSADRVSDVAAMLRDLQFVK
jgi:uncharacterized protein YwgA